MTPRNFKNFKTSNRKNTISTSDLVAINKDSLGHLTSQYNDVKEKTRLIILHNKSAIWKEMNVQGIFKDFDPIFNLFLRDAANFYRSIEKTENENEGNKIANNATLKNTSKSFLVKWRQICNTYEIIDREGINSLIQYIQTKFQLISNVVRDIITRDPKSCHQARLQLSGSNLQENVLQLSNSFTNLLQQREMMHNQEYLIENAVTDIKTFIKIYNDAHYHQFIMSPFMPVQLGQFRANVLAACSDIINALKAAFSFDTEINEVIDIIDAMTKHIQEILEIANLPPTFIKPKTTVITRAFVPEDKEKQKQIEREKRLKLDPLAEVKDFTEGFNGTGFFAITRLETFIKDISDEFDFEIDDELDVWGKLDVLKQQIQLVMKKTKSTEKEHVLFIERIRNQSKTITGLMKQKEQREQEIEVEEREVKARNVDLEERNEELLRQIVEATSVAQRREMQLFQLRESSQEPQLKACLERVLYRMNKIVDAKYQSFSFSKEDLITRADKISSYLSHKKCSKCQQREEEENRLVDRLSEILGYPVDSFDKSVKELLDKYTQTSKEMNVMKRKMQEKEDKLQTATAAVNEIKRRTKELALRIGHSITDDIDNIAEATLVAFNEMDESHKDELIQQEKTIKEEQKSKYRDILDALGITEDERDNLDFIARFCKDLVESNHEMDQTIREYEQFADDIEEFLTTHWNVQKTFPTAQQSSFNESSTALLFSKKRNLDKLVTIKSYMKQIAESPNPLSKPYEAALKAMDDVRASFMTSIRRVSGLLGKSNPTIPQDIEKLISTHDKMIGEVQDIFEKDREKIEKQTNDLEIAHNGMSQLCGRLSSSFGEDIKDMSSFTMEQIVDDLTDLIEHCINK